MNSIIVIAGSAGSLGPLRRLLAALPATCTASVFVVMHIGSNRSILPFLLNRSTKLLAAFALDDALIEPNRIYVAPPDRHMVLERGFIRLNQRPKIHHTRPAADPLFISAAAAYGDLVTGIVLSGGGGDGAQGLRIIKEHGGTAFVQHPEESEQPSMPFAAMIADHPDACLTVADIAEWLRAHHCAAPL